ncbi:hypothetical protein, partial [Vibrio parahaemolyticus]
IEKTGADMELMEHMYKVDRFSYFMSNDKKTIEIHFKLNLYGNEVIKKHIITFSDVEKYIK